MDIEFWQQRWQQNQIGFHNLDVLDHLSQHWQLLAKGRQDLNVLVPLCGKSLDMLWLAQQQCHVTGVEVSPIAVQDFFNENQLNAQVQSLDHFKLWHHHPIKLLCGDFFKLNSEHLNGVDVVYDRAALIAMPPAMRPAYAQHLSQLMPSGAQMFLVTLDYKQEDMAGPPFAVSIDEVKQLYDKLFHITVLGSQDRLDNEPRFKAKGLSQLLENVFLLEKY